MPVALVCDHCGGDFSRSPSRVGPYCSTDCKYAAQVERVHLVCQHCGGEYSVRPSRAYEGRRYCGDACKGAARRQRVEVACEWCGADDEVKRCREDSYSYCSTDCSMEAARASRYGHGHPTEQVEDAIEDADGPLTRDELAERVKTNLDAALDHAIETLGLGEPPFGDEAAPAAADGPEPDDDLVIACPACDRSDPNERTLKTPRYMCRDCGHEFADPVERPNRAGRHDASGERRPKPEPSEGMTFACPACGRSDLYHRAYQKPQWHCKSCGADFERAVERLPRGAPRPKREPAFDPASVADGPSAQPRCQNCGERVSRQYVRVFAPDGLDNPRVCPSCPDMVRDRLAEGGIRQARATRALAKAVDAHSTTAAD